MGNVDFQKILDDIKQFLEKKYIDVDHKVLTPDNYISYIKEVNQILQNNNSDLANFLSPDGDIKKIYFDLTDFNLDETIKEELNIKHNNEIQDKLVIPNSFLEYLGYDLSDIVDAGFIGIAFNSFDKAIHIRYNSKYSKPSKKLKNKLVDIYNNFNTVYCYKYITDQKPGTYDAMFSKDHGDTAEDVFNWLQQIYDSNNE